MCIYIKLNVCVCVCVCTCTCLDTQSCPTPFYNPLDYSLPGSPVHGIFQARILAWVAIAFSRGSSQPRDQACVSRISWITGRFLTTEPPGKPNSTIFQFFKKTREDLPGSSLVKTLVKTHPMQRAQA